MAVAIVGVVKECAHAIAFDRSYRRDSAGMALISCLISVRRSPFMLEGAGGRRERSSSGRRNGGVGTGTQLVFGATGCLQFPPQRPPRRPQRSFKIPSHQRSPISSQVLLGNGRRGRRPYLSFIRVICVICGHALLLALAFRSLRTPSSCRVLIAPSGT
jgi:hypothetical protein